MMKLKILFSFVCAALTVITTSVKPQKAMAQQSCKMTQKFFPEPNVEINTPSFGMDGFVNGDQLVQYINKTTAGKNYVTVRYIGKTQRGKNIPAVIFSKPSKSKKGRVMITGRVHGDEPGGTEALLYLIDKLTNDPELSYLLNKLDIAIIPMVNIDGGEKLQRVSYNGLDLNRDMSKLSTPENKALRGFFTDFAPDVMLDLHEYNPFRADYLQFGSFGVTTYEDAMFLYCENPNYPQPLKDMMQNTFLPGLENALSSKDLTYSKYFTSAKQDGEIHLNMGGASPRSSSTAFGLSNTVSLLTEVRGAGLGKVDFKRRVYTAYIIALEMLKISAQNSPEIQSAIKKSTGLSDDIVVTQRTKEELRTLKFIDIQKNKLIDVEIPVRDAANRRNLLVRKRPVAYAILPDQKLAAEKLTQLGIKVDILEQDTPQAVEAYLVSSYKKGAEQFEKLYEQIVQTKISKETIVLPKGSFIVHMDQRNANLAAVLLEPEAENGFVRFSIISTQMGAELPVYRIRSFEKNK